MRTQLIAVAVSVVTAMFLPTSAQAQVGTVCNINGQTVYCNTAPPVDQTMALRVMTPFQMQREAAQAAAAQNQNRLLQQQLYERRQEREQEQQQQAELQAQNNNRLSIMLQLRGGDCTGAESSALGIGDIDLATKIRTYCATRHQSQSPDAPVPQGGTAALDRPSQPGSFGNKHIRCSTCR